MSKRKFKNDGLNRLKFEKDELKILALNFFKDNQELSKKNMLSSKISKGSYKFRNRCILTSRSRGIFSKLNISRILFRKMFSKGFLPGYRKSSW